MGRLSRVEVEPEVRTWLTGLKDRDFGRADFLVGLLAERAEDLGEPTPVTSAGRPGNCDSTSWPSRPASPTGSRPGRSSSCSPRSARPAARKPLKWRVPYLLRRSAKRSTDPRTTPSTER